MYLSVCPPRSSSSIPGRDGEFQGRDFSLADRTHLERRWVPPRLSQLKGYEEYEVIQLLLPSGPPAPPTIKMVIGKKPC